MIDVLDLSQGRARSVIRGLGQGCSGRVVAGLAPAEWKDREEVDGEY